MRATLGYHSQFEGFSTRLIVPGGDYCCSLHVYLVMSVAPCCRWVVARDLEIGRGVLTVASAYVEELKDGLKPRESCILVGQGK